MKVNGPGSPIPPPPPEPAQGAAKSNAVEKGGRAGQAEGEARTEAGFADKLAARRAAGAETTARAGAADRAGDAGKIAGQKIEGAPAAVTVADLASELGAGKISPRAAIDKVVERVLAQQVGSDATPEVRERLRAVLEDALENDPLLGDKLRRLE